MKKIKINLTHNSTSQGYKYDIHYRPIIDCNYPRTIESIVQAILKIPKPLGDQGIFNIYKIPVNSESELDGVLVKSEYAESYADCYYFDVTNVFKELEKNNNKNAKVRFIVGNAGLTGCVNGEHSIIFYCKEKREKASRKVLVPFNTENVSGGINLAERTLEFEIADTVGIGRMPINVKHVYNSRLTSDYDKVILDNGTEKNLFYCAGYGFKLNYQQYLIVDSAVNGTLSDGESSVQYIWVDAKGDLIRFNKNATTNEITCEYNYTLTVNSDGNYEISDLSNNRLTFSPSSDGAVYRLTKITDSSGNYLTLNYSGINLISIVQNNANKVEIEYDEDSGIIYLIKETVNGSTMNVTFGVNGDFCIEEVYFAKNGNVLSNKNVYLRYTATDENKYYPYKIYEESGIGVYFNCEEGCYSEISQLTTNNGIVNGVVQAIPENESLLLGTQRCKLKELYYISYGERWARVEDVVGESFTTYSFDYLGNCVGAYTEDFNQNTNGNPQSTTFLKQESDLVSSIKTYPNFTDFAINATSSSEQTSLSNFTSQEKYLVSQYVTKQTQKTNANTVVYKGNNSNMPTVILSQGLKEFMAQDGTYSGDIIVSAWAKADSMSIEPAISDNLTEITQNIYKVKDYYLPERETTRPVRFDLCAEVIVDGHKRYFRHSFDSRRKDFQYGKLSIYLKKEEWKQVSSVKVYVDYQNNNGDVYLYGVSVMPGEHQIKKYNEKGFLYTETDSLNRLYNIYTYTNDRLTQKRLVSPTNRAYPLYTQNYEYTVGKLTKEIDSNGISTEYEYSPQGDLIKTTKYHPDLKNSNGELLEITEETLYNTDGSVATVKNGFCNDVANYEYCHNVVSKITPANSDPIEYTYDSTYSLQTKISAEIGIRDNNNVTQYVKGVPVRDTDVASSDTSGNTTVEYDYDAFGRVIAVKINGANYCTFTYTSETDKTVTYANGESFRAVTNKDSTTSMSTVEQFYTKNNEENYVNRCIYNAKNQPISYNDYIAEETTAYYYNDAGKLARVAKVDSFTAAPLTETLYEYDEYQRVKTQTLSANGDELDKITIIYPPLGEERDESENPNLTEYIHTAFGKDSVETDAIGRVIKTAKQNGVYSKEYEYKTVGTRTSNLISKETFKRYSPTTQVNLMDKSLEYTYDALGRVTQITETESGVSRVIQAFTYDGLGRLSREDNYYLDESYVYLYDNAGNITEKLTYPFILNGDLDDNDLSQSKYSIYTNGRLTSHSIIGGTAKTCYYDTLGNPVAYLGKNATWSHGHRLDSFDGISFEYNANGIRTKKTNGSDVTKFILDGDRIVMTESTSSGTMKFYYGVDGLTAFESSGNKYFYQKNIFGDIIGIYDNNFNWVARYVYDAWGNCKVVDEDGSELIYDASSIAHKNPFRYRGYYYDRETGLYYLNARYYDPQIGRFICPDSIEYLDPQTLNGLNLYAYCANNPVMYSDPSGHIAITTFLIGMGIAALIGAGVGAASYVGSEVVSYILTGEWSWSWGMFAGSVLGGGISGALSVIPGVGPVMTAFVSGGASCAIGMSLQNAFGESNYSAKEIVGSSILSAGVSALCAGLIKGTPIQGFNAGRGSLQQVSKQITTKFFNGQIKRISLSTVGKLISYNLAYSSLGSFSSGIVDTIQSYYTKPKNYPTVPAWFC